eukprot:756983-Hanusia_phi.AAC.3
MSVPGGSYYSTYHGHDQSYLERVITRYHCSLPLLLLTAPSMRRSHGAEAPAIFLAGDSTLDNKHWLFHGGQSAHSFLEDQTRGEFTAPAVNGYEQILEPPLMVKDVSYWMNFELAEKKVDISSLPPSLPPSPRVTVLAAVEATTLTSRTGGVQCCCMPTCGGLHAQDELIRQYLKEQDYLVVSVGGNDIALAPSICTIIALLTVMVTPWQVLGRMASPVRPVPADDIPLPATIVCMVYNLDEKNNPSWANSALFCLCYHCAPGILQYRMRVAYDLGVSRVKIPGVRELIPIHLADALDGKDTRDYVARVEPSIAGGRKIACLILSKLGLIESKHV